jgi:hypothetical protein
MAVDYIKRPSAKARTVDKRCITVGMRIDVSRLRVGAPWYTPQEGTGQKDLFIVRLEKKWAYNTRTQEQNLASTTVWGPKGEWVTFYHHFEERIRLVGTVPQD